VIAVKDSYENRLDLRLGIRGLQPQAFARTKSTTIFGATIDIVGCEDLIAMKTFAGACKISRMYGESWLYRGSFWTMSC
jgi:hypothetical protein